MSVIKCIYFLIVINVIRAVYVPYENINKQKLKGLTVRPFIWQSNDEQPEGITVHHNYSRVYSHQPGQDGYNYSSSSSSYSQNGNTSPQINNIEQSSQWTGSEDTGFFDQSSQQNQNFDQIIHADQQNQNFDQQTQNFDQIIHADQQNQNFDQQTQNVDQQNQNFDQHWSNFDEKNQNFDQQSQNPDQIVQVDQQNQNFDQQTQNTGEEEFDQINLDFDQKTQNFDQQTENVDEQTVDQQNQNFDQHWTNLEQQNQNSNKHLNHFDQQINVNQHNYNFNNQNQNSNQGIQNFDGTTDQKIFNFDEGIFNEEIQDQDHAKKVQYFDHGSYNFDQQGADQHSFGQETQNYDQQNQGLGKHSRQFDQQTQNVDQETDSRQINDQLVDFSNTGQQSTQQYGAYDQQVDNFNDRRKFTNAHTGQFTGKSEKIRQNIQINPKETKYFAKEKIGVYKKCPKGATGQFVYELSCNQFLNCWKGRGFVQNCAPGTLFNPGTLECDFKDKVSCITGPRENVFERREPLSAELQAKCPQEFSGLLPHYTDCSKFINCNNGIEIIMDCARGTLFNAKNNICDYPYNTECVGGSENQRTDTSLSQKQQNKVVIIQPYNRNITYHFQKQTLSDHLQGSSNTQTHSVNDNLDNFGNYGSQIERDGKVYQQHGRNNQLGEFDSKNQQNVPNQNQNAYGVTFNLNRYQPNHSNYNNSRQYSNYSSQGAYGITFNPNRYKPGYNQGFYVTKPSTSVDQRPTQNEHIGTTNINQSGIYNGRWAEQNHHNQQNTYNQKSTYNQQTSQSQIEKSKEPKCPAGISGLHPHPSICSKFLNCANGITYIQDCGPGTVFNPTLKVCDFPYNVKCQTSDDIIEVSSHESKQLGGDLVIDNQQSQTQNQLNRNYRMVAALNQMYSMGLDETYCQTHNGFQAYPQNCSIFLYCGNNKLYIGICSENMYYNSQKNICEENAKCQPSGQLIWQPNRRYHYFRLFDIGSEAYTLNLNKYCENNDGFSAHPKNCSKFLLCTNGKLLLGVCNAGTFYSPSKKVCDNTYKCQSQEDNWSSNQQYESFRLIEAGNAMTVLKLDMHYCQSNDGFSTYPKNCSKFLLCHNGKLLLGICKSQRFFNPATKICDGGYKCKYIQTTQNHMFNNGSEANQQNVKFHNDRFIIIDANSEISSPNSLAIYCSVNNQFSEYPKNCSRFLYCKDGRLYVGVCRYRMVYNQTMKTCDFLSKCTPKVTQLGENQISCLSKQNGTYTHPTICSKYVNCYNGKASIGNCATGTLFNPNTKVCDFSNNVKCVDQNIESITEKLSPKYEEGNTVVDDAKPSSFPTTDPNADYVFEYDDLTEVTGPDTTLKDNCGIKDFYCTGTTCIDPTRVCDGTTDCPDGEDEKNCETYIEQFSHTVKTKMAVQEKIKYHNFTVSLCAKKCIESKGFICKAFNFRKLDGTCFLLTTNIGLSGSLFMLPTYDYYEYKNYSINCTEKYVCSNQKCIDNKKVCDGISDCVDRLDEKSCKAEQLGYAVELIGSQKSYEGAVSVTALGKTGYICDDMFNMNAANVLCKELGFKLGAVEVKGNSYYVENLPKGNTFYMMDDIVCSGNESSLRDCDFNGWGNHNCMEKEAVGIVCKIPEEMCAKEYWKCETVNECVPLPFMCDGVDDCADKSDEGAQYCDAAIELRLSNGQVKTEGRVEIKYHGTWGTICDDDFNEDAAKVVCKYLGYGGPARVKKEAYFGEGSGPIWLDQVFCQGNESSLQDCIRWDWGEHNCEHSEDVGVICSDYSTSGSPRSLEPTTEPPPLLPDRCGYRNDDIFLENSDVHFRVVKGSTATKGQYPWQASLRLKGKSRPTHWCGAIVISSKFVLTAAHCLHGYTKGGYVVTAGDYNVNEDEGTEQDTYIEEFYIHPDFRKITRMNNDIALIKLKDKGFRITKDVQPICLPNAGFMDESGLNCTISGFGSIQSGRAVASKELRAGWIPIQPSEICKMPHVYGQSITDGMFCAGSLGGGVDACDGDSGGPLACLQDGLFTLIGMTSWGQHCGEANKPGVYVKIAHYRKWIDETMNKNA